MRSSVAAGLPLSAGPTASKKPPTPTWKNAKGEDVAITYGDMMADKAEAAKAAALLKMKKFEEAKRKARGF